MLDQSFSADNFRKIFDIENRKGNYLEGVFFPDIEEHSQNVKDCIKELRQLRKDKDNYLFEEYDQKLSTKTEELEILKQDREKMLEKQLKEVSDKVCSKNYSFGIQEIKIGKEKKAFVPNKTPETFFALKQIQHNISRLYKVKQSNRQQIICQLRELLADSLPKYIIRTDISSFYESIPRQQILKKLRDEPLLTLQSKKIIRQILYEYSQITGSEKGIPRGIGISAFLAELHMREFDSSIRKLPGVIFYARYVDDIVIIYCPPPNLGIKILEQTIANAFDDRGVKENTEKKEVIDATGSKPFKLTYLGYRFEAKNNKVKLKMSNEKLSRYKRRINLTFSDYSRKRKKSEKAARKLLEKRVRFLTSNTRLVNNKKNVMTGIYFSNPLLNSMEDLKALDRHLQSRVTKLKNSLLISRLQKLSYEYGFQSRQFRKFSAKDLSEIVKVWKYAK